MNTAMKIGMGVGGGYALGRRKKLKLAVGLGAWLLGKRIRLDPQALLVEGLQKLAENPDVMKLSEEVRGQLFQAARAAATKGLTDQLTSLTDTINNQAEVLRSGALAGQEAVGDTAEAAGSAVGDTAQGAGGAVGDTVDGVGGTVGDTVGGLTGSGDDDESDEPRSEDESDEPRAENESESDESDSDESEAESPEDIAAGIEQEDVGLETRGRRRQSSSGDNGSTRSRKPAGARSKANGSTRSTSRAPRSSSSNGSASSSSGRSTSARSRPGPRRGPGGPTARHPSAVARHGRRPRPRASRSGRGGPAVPQLPSADRQPPSRES